MVSGETMKIHDGSIKARRAALFALALLSAAVVSTPAGAADAMIPYDWSVAPTRDLAPGSTQFAFPLDVVYDARRDGEWSVADGVRTWRFSIHVPGAGSLAAQFSYSAVPGSVLKVGQDHYVDSITNRVSQHVAGETLDLVMTSPADSGEPSLSISSLRLAEPRMVQNLPLQGVRAKAADPNPDYVNFNCHKNSGNAANSRAVALIYVDGINQCTATLINNNKGGQVQPMMITAGHCYSVHTDDPNSAAENVDLYWNYEVACGVDLTNVDRATHSIHQFGATNVFARAEHDGDYWLIKLKQWPVPAVGAYLAGFNAKDSFEDGDGIYMINHGEGKPKQFASSSDTLVIRPDKPMTIIASSIAEGSIGVIRPGASGSALIDNGNLVRGIATNGSDGAFYGPELTSIWDLTSFGASLVDDPNNASERKLSGREAPAPVSAPSVTDFHASASSAPVGASFTLTWSTTDATTCTASGEWTGVKAVSGSEQVTFSAGGNHVYELVCTNAAGSDSKSVTVKAATDDDGNSGGGGGGGGAFGIFSLLALLSACGIRAKSRQPIA